MNLVKQHPVLIIVGSVMTTVNAIIAWLVGWPIVHWTEVQTGLVWGIINTTLPPILAIISQQYTTPFDPDAGNTKENVFFLKSRIKDLEDEERPLKAKRAGKAP